MAKKNNGQGGKKGSRKWGRNFRRDGNTGSVSTYAAAHGTAGLRRHHRKQKFDPNAVVSSFTPEFYQGTLKAIAEHRRELMDAAQIDRELKADALYRLDLLARKGGLPAGLVVGQGAKPSKI